VRVLLIQPPFTTRVVFKSKRPPMYEPLGLAYLAAAVREKGYDVAVLDCIAEAWWVQRPDGELTRFGLPEPEIEREIGDFAPDLIGVTCQFTGFDKDCLDVATLAKRALPNVPVVFGGADATARADTFIQNPNIDVIVRGEGETPFLAILEHYARARKLPVHVPGTTVAGCVNPVADEIADLDTVPMPARGLLPMKTYLEDQKAIMPYAKRRPIGFMISSRGCPYNCIFCSTTKIWRKWRPRSPKCVVDEIELLVNDYGCHEIAFQDDSFLANPARVSTICDEILRRSIDISWTVPPGLTVPTVNEEVLCGMRAAGFYRACFPIESGDPAMLAYIRKPIKLDRVRAIIEYCNQLGLWTYGNFIIGFPEQTPESVEKTAEYAINSGLDMINVYVAQPYAGSDLYDVFQDLGLLDAPEADASTVFHTMYDTKHFTAEELRAKRDEIYRRFTRQRIRRLFTPKGLNDLRRKTATPENFAYAVRIFGTIARNSLKARKMSLFG